MASSCPHNCREAPTFHFNSVNQSEDWRAFYIRAFDYLDALDIELDEADDNHKGWKQIKLRFKGEDRQALQTLTDNGTVTLKHMKMPKAALQAIATPIKLEEHFWTYRDELMSDVQQQPGEGIHVLSQCICDLVTKSKFAHPPTQEMLTIMVLQHAVQYHEDRDWIRHQDQSQLTYQALLSHCQLLEQHCEQYQKARERGHANLASIIPASVSSIHMDALSLSHHNCCWKCGYSHPNNKCLAQGQQCYTCSVYNHFTALASKGGANQLANTLQEEVIKTSLPNAVLAGLADNTDSATLLTGTATIMLPGPLSVVPHAAHPIVHCPSSLAKSAVPPHIGTTRTLLRSFLPVQSHQAITLKVCSLLRALQMVI